MFDTDYIVSMVDLFKQSYIECNLVDLLEDFETLLLMPYCDGPSLSDEERLCRLVAIKYVLFARCNDSEVSGDVS